MELKWNSLENHLRDCRLAFWIVSNFPKLHKRSKPRAIFAVMIVRNQTKMYIKQYAILGQALCFSSMHLLIQFEEWDRKHCVNVFVYLLDFFYLLLDVVSTRTVTRIGGGPHKNIYSNWSDKQNPQISKQLWKLIKRKLFLCQRIYYQSWGVFFAYWSWLFDCENKSRIGRSFEDWRHEIISIFHKQTNKKYEI